jgi:DNA-binding transcriptional LysR family regulator
VNNIPPQDLRVFIHAARRASFAAAAASELGASPAYMQSRGEPQTIADLSRHSCLLIRERNETFGRWSLQGPDGTRNVRVSASLASNHGDVIRRWALEGHGIMLRSYWDVAESPRRGDLVQVLKKSGNLPTYGRSRKYAPKTPPGRASAFATCAPVCDPDHSRRRPRNE